MRTRLFTTEAEAEHLIRHLREHGVDARIEALTIKEKGIYGRKGASKGKLLAPSLYVCKVICPFVGGTTLPTREEEHERKHERNPEDEQNMKNLMKQRYSFDLGSSLF